MRHTGTQTCVTNKTTDMVIRTSFRENIGFSFFLVPFSSQVQNMPEDKQDNYYWAEITGKQTFNMTDTKAITWGSTWDEDQC